MALPPNALLATSPPQFVPKTTFASLGNNVKPNLADCYNSADDTRSMAQYPTLASSPSDHFSFANDHQQPSTDDDFGNAHSQNLRLLKHMLLTKEREDPLEGLAMIDAIQRLGVEYHFEEEIKAILERHYDFTITAGISNQHDKKDDLREVALRFRLLRQEGYYVPAGVFEKFKDEEGKFEQELNGDIEGIMSLYEASQLSVRGEGMLDEAEDYSYRLLSSWKLHLDNDQAKAVENTLGHPHHKSLARFMANDFLNSLQGTKGWINALKEFATAEFSMARSQYQREIIQISRWWKNLGLSKELTFARDQPLKWYIWSLACLTDPSLSEQRIELAKPISLIYVIDDIFDVYGTLNELTLFTEVVNRWDIAAADELPHCMKICFKALNGITDEISHKVHKEHGWNPIHSLQKVWASLCRAFLVEAKWFASGKLPNAEEYLKNGIVSSGVHVALVHMFFLLGQGINKESVELIENNPGIISYTATILRLWDDLGSAKDEDQDGHDGSYLECYMQEHQGCLFETAQNQVTNMIRDAWKNLNQECLSPSPFSATFQKASLNAARMVPLMYSYDDSHRLPSLQQHMKSLLYENACTRESGMGDHIPSCNLPL